MNIPEFILIIPGETVALIVVIALLAGVGVWVHLTNPPKVDVDEEYRTAMEELR